jgi:putative transposase
MEKVHADNYGVYGARKVHAEVRRQGHAVARCTVERLMRTAGLRGITRAKGPRTTVPGTGPDTRPDLVDRAFTATGHDQLWVADITYCRTFSGWVYAAFVIDVYSRRVVGWQLSKSLRTDLALDALEMGIWTRRRTGLDLGGPLPRQLLRRLDGYRSVNALAEAFNSLFKAELVRNKGPWRTIDDLEIAAAEYIDWFNHRRLHGEIGLVPPAEHEEHFHRHNTAAATVARVSSEPPRNPGRDSCVRSGLNPCACV